MYHLKSLLNIFILPSVSLNLGDRIVAEETNGNVIVYIYDENWQPLGMQYHGANYAKSTWDIYWFEKNLFGDIIFVRSNTGTVLISYAYNAYGECTTVYSNNGGSTTATLNPFRYRGYYFDKDLNLYYLVSRYYDPGVCRFISPDSIAYLGADADLDGYNLYAYCSNNPIMFTDPSGHSILVALLIGAVAGIVVGGTVGGVISYNDAKEEDLEGSELFWATVEGIGKGALVGGLAGGLIGGTIGVVATYGAASAVGTAMITGTATIAARATEVGVLQYQKSVDDGKTGWQVANDILSSSYNNIGRIMSPTGLKAVTTVNGYIGYYKINPVTFNQYAYSHVSSKVSVAFVVYAWVQTGLSMTSNNPVQRAYQRGYSLI